MIIVESKLYTNGVDGDERLMNYVKFLTNDMRETPLWLRLKELFVPYNYKEILRNCDITNSEQKSFDTDDILNVTYYTVSVRGRYLDKQLLKEKRLTHINSKFYLINPMFSISNMRLLKFAKEYADILKSDNKKSWISKK